MQYGKKTRAFYLGSIKRRLNYGMWVSFDEMGDRLKRSCEKESIFFVF